MLCVLFTHLFCSYQRCLSATVIGNCKICKFRVFRYWYLGSRLSLGPLLKRKRNAPGGMSGTRLWNRGPAVWMGTALELGVCEFGWVARWAPAGLGGWHISLGAAGLHVWMARGFGVGGLWDWMGGTQLWSWGPAGLDGTRPIGFLRPEILPQVS